MPDPNNIPPSARPLLEQRIDKLGLTLETPAVQRPIQQLRRELDRKGLRRFRPQFYLTDEWGCPDEQPIIGIPFYLADPRLRLIERAVVHELETPRQVLMYLRHEAGHALNYAYRLYRTPEWRKMFGPFGRRYGDDYRPTPFSRKYVRHIAGWYAQKHPDEDFAETFAVWLAPRSNWRVKYKSWPALEKLRYVDRVVRTLKDVEPLVPVGEADLTVGDMKLTVARFYDRLERRSKTPIKIALESDLGDIFIPKGRRRKNVRPAWKLVDSIQDQLTSKITYWTGLQRRVVGAMVRQIIETCRNLELAADTTREADYLVELTAYGTTLAMNKLRRGKFEHL